VLYTHLFFQQDKFIKEMFLQQQSSKIQNLWT